MREIPSVSQLKKIAEAGRDSLSDREWDELCALALIGIQAEEFTKSIAELVTVLDEK